MTYDVSQFEAIRPRVEEAVKQWNDRIRTYIRNETRLRLTKEGKRFDVPVRVVAEWPSEVAEILQEATDPLCPLLQSEISTIVSLRHNASRLHDFLPHLASVEPRQTETVRRMQLSLKWAEEVCSELEKYFKSRCDVVPRILALEKDVLGAYLYGLAGRWGVEQRIEIYHPVIGLVAPRLQVQIEALTVVVLIHELAHAYSHLGHDIDENSWDTDAFSGAELAVVEGIAQYFTDRIADKLFLDSPEVKCAYEALLEYQAKPYKVHLEWVNNATPEAVRAALLRCRNRRMEVLAEFEDALAQSRRVLVDSGSEVS
jgi:hypothetical protein